MKTTTTVSDGQVQITLTSETLAERKALWGSGGRHVSYLRVCLGGCEAMGVVPHKPVWAVRGPRGWRPDPSKLERVYGPIAAGEPPSKAEASNDLKWIELEKAHTAHDGYHFVACYFCGGTGRASWIRTLARVPRWIVRGVKTFCQFAERAEVYGPNTTRVERWALSFKVAFLADLGLWRPVIICHVEPRDRGRCGAISNVR